MRRFPSGTEKKGLRCVVSTLVGGVWVEGDGGGGAWREGLDLLWLLLFWSSSLSGAGDGPGGTAGSRLFTDSAFTVVALDVSVTTGGADKRAEPAFRFCPWPSGAAVQSSAFPLAEWMLSMSPKVGSGW